MAEFIIQADYVFMTNMFSLIITITDTNIPFVICCGISDTEQKQAFWSNKSVHKTFQPTLTLFTMWLDTRNISIFSTLNANSSLILFDIPSIPIA